jgi:hypothetical protein
MAKQSTSCDFNAHPIRGGGPVLIDGSTDLIELESDESLDELVSPPQKLFYLL